MGAVTIGVDIGQRIDPTTIAVVEREERALVDGREGRAIVGDRTEWHHLVRHLESLPLGTSYPDVARRLAAVAAKVAERSGMQPRLFLDATGVGKPVVDVLKEHRVKAHLTPVYFTHGDRRLRGEGGSVTLGKAWLVSRLQALLQGLRLHLPRSHPQAELLTRELLDYEIRVDKNANDTYGAFKVGTHDDLVTALGLACQDDGSRLAEAFRTSMMGAGPRESPVMQEITGQAGRAESFDLVAYLGQRPGRRWG